jgi:hypothetical protein
MLQPSCLMPNSSHTIASAWLGRLRRQRHQGSVFVVPWIWHRLGAALLCPCSLHARVGRQLHRHRAASWLAHVLRRRSLQSGERRRRLGKRLCRRCMLRAGRLLCMLQLLHMRRLSLMHDLQLLPGWSWTSMWRLTCLSLLLPLQRRMLRLTWVYSSAGARIWLMHSCA